MLCVSCTIGYMCINSSYVFYVLMVYIILFVMCCLFCSHPRDVRKPYKVTSNLRTKILDFTGVDSSRISMLRGGILMSMGNFPASLSQAILVGRFLVGRLGASHSVSAAAGAASPQATSSSATRGRIATPRVSPARGAWGARAAG